MVITNEVVNAASVPQSQSMKYCTALIFQSVYMTDESIVIDAQLKCLI